MIRLDVVPLPTPKMYSLFLRTGREMEEVYNIYIMFHTFIRVDYPETLVEFSIFSYHLRL